MKDYVKEGMIRAADRGRRMGGATLGYDTKNGVMSINSQEAAAVRFIFKTFAYGKNLTHTANAANDMGYHTKKGKPFNAVSVRTILYNPVYLGIIVFNKYPQYASIGRAGQNESPLEAPGNHQPLITIWRWIVVQHRLATISNGRPIEKRRRRR